MKSRQPAVAAGREARDCLAVVLPVRSPARASALARTTSRSRGSGGRASCQERSRRTLGRWIRIRCTVSHLPGQPPIPGEANGGQPGPGGPALRGTIRIPAAVARHPKVPAGWSLAAGRSLTRRCYTLPARLPSSLRTAICYPSSRSSGTVRSPAAVGRYPKVPAGISLRGCLLEYRCAAVSRPKVLPGPLWEGERGTPFPSTERKSCRHWG